MAKFFNGIISEPMISYNMEDGSIDYETTAKLYRYLAESGAGGLFVNGFGNEVYSCSLEERVELAKCALKSVEGTGCPVVGVVLVTCLRDALWLIKEYEKVGVQALSISLPPFYELTDDAVHEYLGKQLESTDLPTMIFNCREMDELVTPEMLGRLAHEYKNCLGYKDATRDIVHLTKFMDAIDDIKDDFSLISGCDATLYAHMLLGASASVTFMSIPFFKEMKAIYDNFIAGDLEAAWQAQRKVLTLRTFMQQFPDSAAYIYGMKYEAKIDIKGTRHPIDMLSIPEEGIKEFDELVKKLGIC